MRGGEGEGGGKGGTGGGGWVLTPCIAVVSRPGHEGRASNAAVCEEPRNYADKASLLHSLEEQAT